MHTQRNADGDCYELGNVRPLTPEEAKDFGHVLGSTSRCLMVGVPADIEAELDRLERAVLANLKRQVEAGELALEANDPEWSDLGRGQGSVFALVLLGMTMAAGFLLGLAAGFLLGRG